MAVDRRSSQLRLALHALGGALLELDRRADAQQQVTHDFLARLCQRAVKKGPGRQTYASVRLRLNRPQSNRGKGEGQPPRWTCTYQGLAGANGRATFDSGGEARSFAELHANLTCAPVGKWEQVGDYWV